MSSNRFSVCAKLCLSLLIWLNLNHGVEGRPWSQDQVGGFRMPDGTISINTGPAEGGTVNIVVYPWIGKWSHGREELQDLVPTGSTTTTRPSTSRQPHEGTTRRTPPTKQPHVVTTRRTPPTTTRRGLQTTRVPPSTTIGVNPNQIIIAPPRERECAEGERVDITNNCREEWDDFSRIVRPKQSPERSTSAPDTTVRTSSVGHQNRRPLSHSQ